MEEQRVELIRLQKLNSVLAEEKRSMHFELNSLKKSLYEKKSVTNDLRTEITRSGYHLLNLFRFGILFFRSRFK